MYGYGLIGNCQVSSLVHESGSIDWLCLPRPDSPPVFGKILDPEGGAFSIVPLGKYTSSQSYIPNTNVLVTTVTTEDGSYKITDFCPRFEQYGRMYRPNALFRILEPLSGHPKVRISCKPVNGWSKKPVKPVRGNSHLRYDIGDDSLRLVTSMPLTHLADESNYAVGETVYFGLSWSFGIEEDLVRVSQDFLSRTIEYWHTWVKHCSIPALFQSETIRSALALKLHVYEDTGAILAALTTSLPEEHGNTRNWDYRFCWLRDAYYVLTAFHNLGHFEEMEGFLKFLLGIGQGTENLRPVYRIDQSAPLPETEHTNWNGFGKSQPVRSNNDAANHVQNDVYGEMILSLTPIFFDERFSHLRHRNHESLLADLARRCTASIGKPDAGLWEIRNGWQQHTFTDLMSWAGLDRLRRLQQKGFLKDLELDLQDMTLRAQAAIEAAVVDGSVRNGPKDPTFDAALLQLPMVRYPDEELSARTVNAIHAELAVSENPDLRSFLYRYKRSDDFGNPQSAFLVCSFWYIQALAKIGRVPEARKALEGTLSAANRLGLFSEHFDPFTKQQLGNFPQAYSHVGLINAAFSVSPSWDQVL
ncbi:MAG: hypothetical protein A2X94_01645 [Bdellovibrionales bacterium GWB1_55_8]|nr:MAG: hypothetical protein A2X94_01645 [Bdellovibrionales bacterium GWB1_55_8]